MADRRTPFFLVSAAVCFLLVPVADAQFRWVALATGVTYLLLAGLVAADELSRARSPNKRTDAHPPSSGDEGASW